MVTRPVPRFAIVQVRRVDDVGDDIAPVVGAVVSRRARAEPGPVAFASSVALASSHALAAAIEVVSARVERRLIGSGGGAGALEFFRALLRALRLRDEGGLELADLRLGGGLGCLGVVGRRLEVLDEPFQISVRVVRDRHPVLGLAERRPRGLELRRQRRLLADQDETACGRGRGSWSGLRRGWKTAETGVWAPTDDRQDQGRPEIRGQAAAVRPASSAGVPRLPSVVVHRYVIPHRARLAETRAAACVDDAAPASAVSAAPRPPLTEICDGSTETRSMKLGRAET